MLVTLSGHSETLDPVEDVDSCWSGSGQPTWLGPKCKSLLTLTDADPNASEVCKACAVPGVGLPCVLELLSIAAPFPHSSFPCFGAIASM